jgi:hypothetical protein
VNCSPSSNISTLYLRRVQYTGEDADGYPILLRRSRRQAESSEHVPILPLPASAGCRQIPARGPQL